MKNKFKNSKMKDFNKLETNFDVIKNKTKTKNKERNIINDLIEMFQNI